MMSRLPFREGQNRKVRIPPGALSMKEITRQAVSRNGHAASKNHAFGGGESPKPPNDAPLIWLIPALGAFAGVVCVMLFLDILGSLFESWWGKPNP